MHEQVAAEVLAAHGVDVETAVRGRGWTNATWLADELVVRVATRPGPADLLREARLIALLPPEVGCPPVVDAGVRHGHEWVLTRRVAGENLEEVWPTLDGAARARAVTQMWERARHLHRVDPAVVAPFVRARSPFFPGDPAEAVATLDRLVVAGELARGQARVLGRVLDRFWTALPAAPRVPVHGDLCTPNTLWHDGRVVALLDLEFAVVAPAAVDLNEILKTAYGPGGDEPLRAAVRPIAASALPTAGGPDVLLGYAVLLEAWLLAAELAADEPDEAGRAEVGARLAAFAEGDGGHFAPLLADLR